MKRNLLLLLLLALVLPGTAIAALAPAPQVGDIPPPMLGKTRDGKPVDLASLHGKVVIVTFWASWCGPCRQEIPVMGHFQKVVSRDALQVYAVNFKEPRSDFVDVIRSNPDVDLDYIHDARGIASNQYGVKSLPNMFIIDREGKIAHVHNGYAPSMLPKIIEEILALLPPEVRERDAGAAPAG